MKIGNNGKRILEIINIMISYGMFDKARLIDKEYVVNRIKLYLEVKHFVDTNFKGFLIWLISKHIE